VKYVIPVRVLWELLVYTMIYFVTTDENTTSGNFQDGGHECEGH
jgi:hypothetical protein